ncbi:PREDICTED: uncharacterized protein LOC107186918 [Dufourea novaeangliae]|uniref:uncharacterized protein LOC107186918 n=1 Tax=Dufourea novaeangliae TaxID=178035 RepID=UPI0007672EED|nr:PREDICTED: uncharacterized protein LOC107186918 [Dufourea novaeangliae]
MNPVKLRFYTERYEKEKKHLQLQEEFVAIGRTQPLTGKFYAKHDVISPSKVRQEYVDLITRRAGFPPKDVYPFDPPTVNGRYGWFVDTSTSPTNDPRLRFPRTKTDFVANELEIRFVQRGLPVEKFTGIPFKV